MRQKLTLRKRLESFRFALRGISTILRTQPNAWIHAAATLIVAALGLALNLEVGQWCWLALAVIAVWSAEAFNTALELLCDVASPAFHPLIEKAKDVSAGAVLIAAIGAALIGGLIFVPRLLELF